MKMRSLPLLGTLVLLNACEETKTTASQAAASVKAALNTSGVFVERYPTATLSWEVDENGETKLAVRSASCELLNDKVSGSLAFIGLSGAEPKTAELKVDKAKGILMAKGPALDKEATELRYQLMVDGAAINGALHLPKEGTKALVSSAVESESVPEEMTGPHGGEITVVAGQRYELAADETSGEVRVYGLDQSGKVVEVQAEKMQLLIGGPESKVVDLVSRKEAPSSDGDSPAEGQPSGEGQAEKGDEEETVAQPAAAAGDNRPHFAGIAGKWAAGRKISLLVRREGKTRVSVVGHRKGRALVVGHARVKQRHWSRRGWRGVGLKLGHRLKAPPGFDKGEVAVKAKRGKHLGQKKDHENQGKHLGQKKDHENQGKHLGQKKDHENQGKHLGQKKDHENQGKHLGQKKDHENQGKHLGQKKAPGGKPAAPGKKK